MTHLSYALGPFNASDTRKTTGISQLGRMIEDARPVEAAAVSEAEAEAATDDLARQADGAPVDETDLAAMGAVLDTELMTVRVEDGACDVATASWEDVDEEEIWSNPS